MALSEIIKYEGDNSTFVWKHPCEDFNTTSQLIVHESQEAILFLNGQALDLFGPGRHTLETQNIPLLRRIVNIPTGGESAFHCEVYFINKTEQMAIRWGTDSKVQYVEPTYKFPLSIGASGEMTLSVEDSRKLLVKLVGTERSLDRAHLTAYFRSIFMTKVKTYMAQIMRANAVNIFEVDEYLESFSTDIQQRLIPDFADYFRYLLLQNLGQSDGVCNFIDLIAAPVVGLRDLLVENGQIGPDELALFLPDLFVDHVVGEFFGAIQHITRNSVLVPFRFCKNTVFSFAFCSDTYPMLCQPAKHIVALADVNQAVINADCVNAGVFKLFTPTAAFQQSVCVFLIGVFLNGTILHGIPPL